MISIIFAAMLAACGTSAASASTGPVSLYEHDLPSYSSDHVSNDNNGPMKLTDADTDLRPGDRQIQFLEELDDSKKFPPATTPPKEVIYHPQDGQPPSKNENSVEFSNRLSPTEYWKTPPSTSLDSGPYYMNGPIPHGRAPWNSNDHSNAFQQYREHTPQNVNAFEPPGETQEYRYGPDEWVTPDTSEKYVSDEYYLGSDPTELESPSNYVSEQPLDTETMYESPGMEFQERYEYPADDADLKVPMTDPGYTLPDVTIMPEAPDIGSEIRYSDEAVEDEEDDETESLLSSIKEALKNKLQELSNPFLGSKLVVPVFGNEVEMASVAGVDVQEDEHENNGGEPDLNSPHHQESGEDSESVHFSPDTGIPSGPHVPYSNHTSTNITTNSESTPEASRSPEDVQRNPDMAKSRFIGKRAAKGGRSGGRPAGRPVALFASSGTVSTPRTLITVLLLATPYFIL